MSADASSLAATGPRTDAGKAVAARNATTHGLFARDIVLPTLGEDIQGYRKLEAEWLAQLPPRSLLEQHYVEKIAAASWRLRRLHRWQAQLFEDDTLTEDQRLDKLEKVLRHETTLHRQIDTAVKMLNKDVPQLYNRRVRDQVLEETMTSERECRDSARDETEVELETRGRLRRIRWATEAAVGTLAPAPLDMDAAAPGRSENSRNEPSVQPVAARFIPPAFTPSPADSLSFAHSDAAAFAPGISLPAEEWEDEAVEPEAEDAGEPQERRNCRNEPRPWPHADCPALPDSFPALPPPHPPCVTMAQAKEQSCLTLP